VKPR
jgi:proteasome lid subunit RPN8/RPN11